ncbi:G-type lectin S-receptor-like serine/threonine-protein kinase At2g19130 [Cryptomeria japonica]|uniref:G-type lectin S-receptor-like serine/threonine-protein kinase At2g19130 n=1 Tax=Cryptomeria japonica TaxID=3369 RepID=UPI0027DA7BDB|nr:G-type lectin S-receptor-like serine/threonine-protein kinase At2g19130 [Cryptomeria japonica]
MSPSLLKWRRSIRQPDYFIYKSENIIDKKYRNAIVIEMARKYLFLAISLIITANYCSAVAMNGGATLLMGSSLSGSQTIISKNGTFALGFFNPRGTNNWYIGIWYAPIPQKAIVWVANRDNPVRNMPGVLKFSRGGQLTLFDRNGRSVWSTDNGPKGSGAVITDSGNFIVLDAHNESAIVWESFAHPTDTLLPDAKLWKGMTLTSWKSSSDPESGLYSFRMNTSPGKTELMMLFNNTVPYWSSGECIGHNYFTKVPELEGQKKVQTSCVRLSPSRIYIYFSINPIDRMIKGRFVLNENGDFELFFWMDDGRWSLRWSTYQCQCSNYKICGSYGLCNTNDVCSCVQGFTPKHDSQGWWSTGCARGKPLECSVTEGTTDGLLEATNQYLPEKEAVLINNEPTQQGCRTACLHNCSCTAFAFADSDPPVCKLAKQQTPALTILLSAGASILVFSALLSTAYILWKRRGLSKKNVEEEVPLSLRMFSYKELRIATENFKHKLGSGALGSVFKGTLPDNRPVAVKRLEGSTQVEKQFRAEIITTGRIQHVNLVRLWGFCVEGSRRLLVYAYMPNGSLNSFLFSQSEDVEKVLDWKTRFEIALGTARGLVYLHEECRDRIIHCDIKPENILLDSDLSPKVADFGLAKLVGRDFSRVLTTTKGTRGYLAPEWISGLPITPKVDRGNIKDIVDARIAGEANIEEVKRAAMVARLCIQDDENQRPSMGEVVKILEGTIEVPLPQIPTSLEVLVCEVDYENTDSYGEHSMSGGSVTEK